MDKLELLGLQRAEFQRSETMDSRRNKVQFVIVITSIGAVFLGSSKVWAVILLAILGLLLALLGLYFAFQAKSSHGTAERARRMLVYMSGLGIKPCPKSYTDLRMQFKVDDAKARKFEDPDYFKTTQDYGDQRLAEILEESSFWSKHLFHQSATRYWIRFALSLIVSIVVLLLMAGLDFGEKEVVVSQLFCVVLIWLVTGSVFRNAMAFTFATKSVDDIEGRVTVTAREQEPGQDILIMMGDYNAIMESSPTIPSDIYSKQKKKLNQLWRDRAG